jgi:hypothetical protein
VSGQSCGQAPRTMPVWISGSAVLMAIKANPAGPPGPGGAGPRRPSGYRAARSIQWISSSISVVRTPKSLVWVYGSAVITITSRLPGTT